MHRKEKEEGDEQSLHFLSDFKKQFTDFSRLTSLFIQARHYEINTRNR